MASTKRTRNVVLGSLLATGMLAGGLALPASAQNATAAPSSAPSMSSVSDTDSLDAKVANVKQIGLRVETSLDNGGIRFEKWTIGDDGDMTWKDGAWVGRSYWTPFATAVSFPGESDLTATATITYKDGTESKPVKLTTSDFNANAPVPLGATQANSRQFTGTVDGMPIKIAYVSYDAVPIGFWNLARGVYPMRTDSDGIFRYDDPSTYSMFKDQNGNGWHPNIEKVIFYSVDREGFNGPYDKLPSLPITWGDPQKTTENGRHVLKFTGIAKGEIAGQNVEIILHGRADDPNADTNRTWTYIDPKGIKQNIWYEGGKMRSGISASYDKLPKTLTATNDDGESVVLNREDHTTVKPGDQLGVSTITGTVLYTAEATDTHPVFEIFGHIDDTTGTPVTIKDGPAFTHNNDGTFTATNSNYTLDSKNQPSSDTVTLSNGQTAPITWEQDVQNVDKDIDGKTTKLFIRRTGTATGTVGEQKFTVTTIAERAYNAHVTLSITQTPTQGNPTRIKVPDATNVDAQDLKDTYTLDALPQDQADDEYVLNVDAANQSDVKVGDPTDTIGENGERHLTTTITYTDTAGEEQSKTVTVIIPFDKDEPATGNPDDEPEEPMPDKNEPVVDNTDTEPEGPTSDKEKPAVNNTTAKSEGSTSDGLSATGATSITAMIASAVLAVGGIAGLLMRRRNPNTDA